VESAAGRKPGLLVLCTIHKGLESHRDTRTRRLLLLKITPARKEDTQRQRERERARNTEDRRKGNRERERDGGDAEEVRNYKKDTSQNAPPSLAAAAAAPAPAPRG